MQSLVYTIIKERIAFDFLAQACPAQQVGMKQKRPAADERAFSVILLAADLSWSDTYQRTVFIVIFAAAVQKVEVIVLLQKDTIDIVAVQAVAYRSDTRILDDSYERVTCR